MFVAAALVQAVDLTVVWMIGFDLGRMIVATFAIRDLPQAPQNLLLKGFEVLQFVQDQAPTARLVGEEITGNRLPHIPQNLRRISEMNPHLVHALCRTGGDCLIGAVDCAGVSTDFETVS